MSETINYLLRLLQTIRHSHVGPLRVFSLSGAETSGKPFAQHVKYVLIVLSSANFELTFPVFNIIRLPKMRKIVVFQVSYVK